jgi:hypothetical protein
MFSVVLPVCTGPGGFLFTAEAVHLKLCIHKFMVLWPGTLPRCGMLNCQQNKLCVVTTQSPSKENVSTMNAQGAALLCSNATKMVSVKQVRDKPASHLPGKGANLWRF